MNVLYKPKYAIKTSNKLSSRITYNDDNYNMYPSIYEVYAATNNLVYSLIQIEVYKIINHSLELEYNISKIYNDFLIDNKNPDLHNLLNINMCCILFYVSNEFYVCWPIGFEDFIIKNAKDIKGVNSILTYDEFMIKNILE